LQVDGASDEAAVALVAEIQGLLIE
jgi:hypothetical protein